MEYDYSRLQSVPDDVFKKAATASEALLVDATVSDPDDISRMERLLDLMEGTLKGSFRFQKLHCARCDRLLTFYDFVYTSIVDAGHPKSFVVHTLVGSKRLTNRPRQIRCSSCNTVTPKDGVYWHETYGGCSY